MAAEERDALYPIWTTDDKHVYGLGRRRIRADRASFRMLNDVFARDRNTVFAALGPLREADAESFEIVSTWRDDETGNMYHSYAKDKANVFFDSGAGKPRLMKGADPSSFKWLGKDYGADNRRVYLAGYLVEGADPATFRHHKGPYATDASHCFYRTKRLRKLEPDTFSVIEYEGMRRVEFARDAHRVVFRDFELAGADPATLVVRDVGNLYPAVSDKNRSWSYADLSTLLHSKDVAHVYPTVVVEGEPSAMTFSEDNLQGLEMQIVVFCAVVHFRSAEQAAKQGKWHYTPETVCRYVETLQAKLGVRLAVIESGRIVITPDGLAFHRQFGAPVDFMANLIGMLKQQMFGR
jgi:DKNYY family